jgi:type II secretory pathway component GspD/PulD (secretin)
VTPEQALQQIASVNQLRLSPATGRFSLPGQRTEAQHDEQVVQTFYVPHATDGTGRSCSLLIRLPSMAVQPAIQFNKAANTITVRGTASVVQIIEKVIQNDKARAEIAFDVEILENRSPSMA